MDFAKGNRFLRRAAAVLIAAGGVALSPLEASPHLYEYGLQLTMMAQNPIVTGLGFTGAAARNARFCVADMDNNGRLEFFLAKADENGRYRDFEGYEAGMDAGFLSPVIFRRGDDNRQSASPADTSGSLPATAVSGFRPGIAGLMGECRAYRHINDRHREERYYQIYAHDRKDGKYLTAQQIVSLRDGVLSVLTVATEQGVCGESRPGTLTFTPDTYRAADGREIDGEAYERADESHLPGAEKTTAEFLWLPVTELETAVARGSEETWNILQKSWQGYRFGHAPRGFFVCCYSRDGQSLYLDPDSINIDNLPPGMTYRIEVNAFRDGDGSPEGRFVYGFESQNDALVGAVYDESAGRWADPSSDDETLRLKAVWEAMKPFLKLKGISYSDALAWR